MQRFLEGFLPLFLPLKREMVVPLPSGLGFVVRPDGGMVAAAWARLVPSGNGFKTASPTQLPERLPMERSNDSEDEMARPHLQFANKALGFSDDPTRDQEWGYLNADRSRLGEFLDFFEQQRMVRAPFLRDFIELVMFSFGEQLVSDLSTGTHFGQQFEHRMREFVKICRNYRHRDAFRTVLTAQEACDQPLKNWLEEVLLSFGADTTWYIHD